MPATVAKRKQFLRNITQGVGRVHQSARGLSRSFPNLQTVPGVHSHPALSRLVWRCFDRNLVTRMKPWAVYSKGQTIPYGVDDGPGNCRQSCIPTGNLTPKSVLYDFFPRPQSGMEAKISVVSLALQGNSCSLWLECLYVRVTPFSSRKFGSSHNVLSIVARPLSNALLRMRPHHRYVTSGA